MSGPDKGLLVCWGCRVYLVQFILHHHATEISTMADLKPKRCHDRLDGCMKIIHVLPDLVQVPRYDRSVQPAVCHYLLSDGKLGRTIPCHPIQVHPLEGEAERLSVNRHLGIVSGV